MPACEVSVHKLVSELEYLGPYSRNGYWVIGEASSHRSAGKPEAVSDHVFINFGHYRWWKIVIPMTGRASKYKNQGVYFFAIHPYQIIERILLLASRAPGGRP